MKDVNFGIIYEQYFLRAAFTRVKGVTAALLLEQGLYPEHQRLQVEISKETNGESFMLSFLNEHQEAVDKNVRGENGLLPS